MNSDSNTSRKGLRILLFGALADEYGQKEVSLFLQNPLAAEAAFAAITRHRLNLFAKWRDLILYARNEEHIDKDVRVFPGDELAIMPPLAGG